PLLLAIPSCLRGVRDRADAGGWWRWVAGLGLVVCVAAERLSGGSASGLWQTALYATVILALSQRWGRRPAGAVIGAPAGDDAAGSPAAGLSSAAPGLRDFLLIAVLWLPLELRLVGGNSMLLRLLGLDLVLLLYLVERPLWDPGRILPARAAEWRWALGAYAAFLVVAIPFAVVTGFAVPGMAERAAGGWALFFFSTFWIVALPEEALFRGAIQRLLEGVLRNRPIVALLIASVVFGLAHLNNRNGAAPDWRYVLLATLAGIAYGTAFRRTGNLAAPVLCHFLVDITWRGLFAGGR
ncbi:MAG TPA: CPBP family intramembrane glutamic endopeptidase, partial [Methylomirabilota bacterium]|nr:CPBP family intramembrane glutamic endopeptidase [Methylomirabilota bacterium]